MSLARLAMVWVTLCSLSCGVSGSAGDAGSGRGKGSSETSAVHSGPTAAPTASGKPLLRLEPFKLSQPGTGPTPLVALWEKDPWLNVIGSDVPTLVLYDDGRYVRNEVVDRKVARMTGTLSGSEATAFANRIDALLAQASASCSLSLSTDQREVMMLSSGVSGHRFGRCYALQRDTRPNGRGPWPTEFVDAYHAVLALKSPDETTWVPQDLEIMLWGFEHAREASKPWPDAVPRPPAVSPPATGVVKHVVSTQHEPAMRQHLASLGQSQATEFNGFKWSLGVRIRVPNESLLARLRQCGFERTTAAILKKPTPDC